MYSNYSQASKDLLSYIKGLPLDFPQVTGMTMICIDHYNFKDMLKKNGIEYVPTLLVEYFKGATPHQIKQKFERDYIYMWIDQVMKALYPPPSIGDDPQHQQETIQEEHIPHKRTSIGSQQPRVSEVQPVQVPVPVPVVEDDVPQIQKKEKVDITLLAQQMAKERESYISESTLDKKNR